MFTCTFDCSTAISITPFCIILYTKFEIIYTQTGINCKLAILTGCPIMGIMTMAPIVSSLHQVKCRTFEEKKGSMTLPGTMTNGRPSLVDIFNKIG
ncbi:hypothetical protein DOT_4256 [Desulfosporosinus sp. OT]|nr:hypothetical protein DOT_4256 [Desulfosporosinus sp. OT]